MLKLAQAMSLSLPPRRDSGAHFSYTSSNQGIILAHPECLDGLSFGTFVRAEATVEYVPA